MVTKWVSSFPFPHKLSLKRQACFHNHWMRNSYQEQLKQRGSRSMKRHDEPSIWVWCYQVSKCRKGWRYNSSGCSLLISYNKTLTCLALQFSFSLNYFCCPLRNCISQSRVENKPKNDVQSWVYRWCIESKPNEAKTWMNISTQIQLRHPNKNASKYAKAPE